MEFMKDALQGVPEGHRTMPDGLVTLRISPESGTLVSAENSDGVPEMFMVDHLPAAEEAGNQTPTPENQPNAEPIF
jgi:penicillin-binding protein 1A